MDEKEWKRHWDAANVELEQIRAERETNNGHKERSAREQQLLAELDRLEYDAGQLWLKGRDE